jgi:hypothetical protein
MEELWLPPSQCPRSPEAAALSWVSPPARASQKKALLSSRAFEIKASFHSITGGLKKPG